MAFIILVSCYEAANDTVRNAKGDVVDKNKEQDGTKNCSLWDTTND